MIIGQHPVLIRLLCMIEDYLKEKTAITLTKNDGTKIEVKKTDYVKYFE